MKFSIIIPVYNRPEEIKELLETLTLQTYSDFEVLIIEDGSTQKCDSIVQSFAEKLTIQYFYKANSGQGFSRNYGFERAKGDFLIVFDSDCLIPPQYLEVVNQQIQQKKLDAFGGPDRAHPSFTPTQKAISYAMTSLFSTGGIRGRKKSAERFRPRSFNMGISREVFEKTRGYKITRMGEDIEFSVRIEQMGFKIGLISDAFVFHKRRTSFRQFYKQLHFFGRARINVWRFFPKELKWVHTFPALFVFFCTSLPLVLWLESSLFQVQFWLLVLYFTMIFSDSLAKNKNLFVAFLSVIAVVIQLFAYGIGFLTEWMRSK